MKAIRFNTEMVQALLAGRKTETRQVLKPANLHQAKKKEVTMGAGMWVNGYDEENNPCRSVKDYSVSPCWMREEYYIKNHARYKVGDILYVRETWTTDPHSVALFSIKSGDMPVWYKADYEKRELKELFDGVWCQSNHMPQEAARIFLRVTGVRIERLQDISEGDSIAEGCTPEPFGYCNGRVCAACDGYNQHGAHKDYKLNDERCFISAKIMFSDVWDSTVKKTDLDAYGWDANPWVWVYEFERVFKNGERYCK